MTVAAAALFVVLGLGGIGDERLGGEHDGGDRGGMRQRADHDLGGVDDAALDEVAVVAGAGVEALVALQLGDAVGDGRTIEAAVLRDDPQRLLERAAHDPRAGRCVTLERQPVDGGSGRSSATPPPTT